MSTIKLDNVYKQNNAFSGFIIDKVYASIADANSDINNIELGEYVLIQRDETKAEIDMLLIEEEGSNPSALRNCIYQKVYSIANDAEYILNFITTLSPISYRDMTAFIEATVEETAQATENGLKKVQENLLIITNSLYGEGGTVENPMDGSISKEIENASNILNNALAWKSH